RLSYGTLQSCPRTTFGKGPLVHGRQWWLPVFAALACAPLAQAACCYFAAKDKDILQPGQKVFLTWEPVEKVESFTVQPKFEGNADDCGMVTPSPSSPRLDEMPRDFFKELAIYSILKKREKPHSKLLWENRWRDRKVMRASAPQQDS